MYLTDSKVFLSLFHFFCLFPLDKLAWIESLFNWEMCELQFEKVSFALEKIYGQLSVEVFKKFYEQAMFLIIKFTINRIIGKTYKIILGSKEIQSQ